MTITKLTKQMVIGCLLMAGSVTSGIAAGIEPAQCLEEGVMVPCAQQRWQFGVHGLYVQPTSDNLAFAQSPGRIENLRYKWTLAFQLDFGYHFGQGNDLLFSWRRIDKITNRGSQDLLIPSSFGPIPVLPPVALPPPLTLFPQGIEAQAEINEHHIVALDFGKSSRWGEKLTTRHFAGIQYVRVESNLQADGIAYRPPSLLEPVTKPFPANTVETLSRFNGIGARVGIEGAYEMIKGFAIVGSGLVGASYGEVDYKQIVTVVVNPIDLTREALTSIRTRTNTVSPNAEGRVGLRYTRNWSEINQVQLEAGYLAANFWSTVRGSQAYVTATGGLTNGLGVFGYHGPYVKLSWIGA
jgi:Legionella pneumophila major outer membrane protein precursor